MVHLKHLEACRVRQKGGSKDKVNFNRISYNVYTVGDDPNVELIESGFEPFLEVDKELVVLW